MRKKYITSGACAAGMLYIALRVSERVHRLKEWQTTVVDASNPTLGVINDFETAYIWPMTSTSKVAINDCVSVICWLKIG